MGAQMAGVRIFSCEHGVWTMSADSDNPCSQCATHNKDTITKGEQGEG
jgi:hypothetical protein